MTTDYLVEMAFHGVTIRNHSRGRMSCTATHFRIEMQLEAHEDGKLVFARRWDEEIARDMV